MSARYAVMGNPIAHSKSPEIHVQFAKALGLDIRYERILVPLDGFREAVERFVAEGGAGFNVTVPFKEEAFELCPTRSDRAARARAVNTVRVEPSGALRADNTDGIGLVTDLRVNHGVDLAGKNVLVLGAGGAVRGVLGPLLDQLPARLWIANRTASRAEQLVRDFQERTEPCPARENIGWGGVELIAGGFADLDGTQFDVLINGTSAGLNAEVPDLAPTVFAVGATAYDMMYGSAPTAFSRWASQAGAARVYDGLGMLIEQAAAAFEIWTQKKPNTGPVIASMR